MRANKIRSSKTNQNVNKNTLESVCFEIVSRTAKVGFITDAEVLTETSINIGLHMRSFRINTEMLGHNARVNSQYGPKSIKGYKRTDVPTWEQRVEFNNIINAVFDKFKLDAKIISGNYTVRELEGAITNWSYGGDRGSNGFSANASDDIMEEIEAKEYCNSDELLKQHKLNQKPVINERAKLYRQHIASLKCADFVAFETREYVRNLKIKIVQHILSFEELKAYNSKPENSWTKIKLTDCRPAYGKTKRAALNYLKVMDRLTDAVKE